MRRLLLLLALGPVSGLFAQQQVRIKDAAALEHAQDVRKLKGVQEALFAAGLSKEEIGTVLDFGNKRDWPEGIRSDTARARNAPYVVNYAAFRICNFMLDSAEQAVVMVPARSNIHMPEGMRPLGDFYLVLPEEALMAAEKPEVRPAVSRGPSWSNLPKAKITKPDDLYGAYDLSADSIGLKALEHAGMSQAEIDAVVFRSFERNWPDGIDNLQARATLLKKFPKYRAFLGAKWADKVLLIVPAAKNRRMPAAMRPYLDLYFVYKQEGVKVKGK